MLIFTVAVTPDSLSVDVIKQAALGAGHFLGADQTLKLMETEFTYPKLADHASPDDWAEAGSTDIWDRASAHAEVLLSARAPMNIDAETDKHIRELFNILLPREAGI